MVTLKIFFVIDVRGAAHIKWELGAIIFKNACNITANIN
jgi:hypothetical protein